MTTWSDLAAVARTQVREVADDPDARLRLREDFYLKYGFAEVLIAAAELDPALDDAKFGFGRSELDFMRWEIRRGVLDPGRGSPWWRAVNLSFLFDGQLAGLGHEAGLDGTDAPLPAKAWLAYIDDPSSVTWYRAHNTSIVSGYLEHSDLAPGESRPEQIFLNCVLYRLLFAQGMVEGVEFEKLGRFLADPRLPSVDVLVHLPDFYPDRYPLNSGEAKHVMHRGHSLEEASARCLDLVLIHPQLVRLYGRAAVWNATPFLVKWVVEGEPCYPHGRPHNSMLAYAARLVRRIRGKRRAGASPRT